MQQTDIDWAARIMIARHGDDAASAAQRRATHLLKRNDPDIAALWVRVEQAVRMIQRQPIPAGNETANEPIRDSSRP